MHGGIMSPRHKALPRRLPVLGVLLLISLLVGACGTGGSTLPAGTYTPSANAVPNFSHVFVILMENHGYSDIVGNTADAPYLNQLAGQYDLLTQYYAISHPSLPNYLALIGGDTFGTTSDCTDCFVNAPNLVDALETGHKTWRAYMESMPSPCFVGDSGQYYQKHDPFIYFDDIRSTPSRCQNVVPLDSLQSDLADSAMPDFVWITPNICHDMHDCSIGTGDTWLSQEVPLILASNAWKQNGALFITWDEAEDSDTSGCCRYAAGGLVATLVISPLVKAGGRSSTPYDHYSLLRTISAAWGLTPPAHAGDPATAPITGIWSAT
jgi:phosphatidylinositol-3-phosphatase